MIRRYAHIVIAALALLAMACEPETLTIVPNPEPEPEPVKPEYVIPSDMKSLPMVFIETPGHVGVTSKTNWVENATIKILGDGGATLLEADSLKIRGRGNSTWWNYPKRPYSLKFGKQVDLYGTGKSKKWVLLANYMDRTLLRNQVAFEASRMTSMEWTPYGKYVELYLNGSHLGLYWLGEKISVEGSKFKADYLYSFDTSDGNECDFTSSGTFMHNSNRWGAPVEVKYPDRDDYEPKAFSEILTGAQSKLNAMTNAITFSNYSNVIDVDSFCDWYLVHELCYNLEPNHPKSCFFHMRSGKMYAGPIWDFDWYTFQVDAYRLDLQNCLWYGKLLADDAFKARLKERWADLKPKFETLPDYIDAQASLIRRAEATNWAMWPCYPNPLAGDYGMINNDENLSFDEAIEKMKQAITKRIGIMDSLIPAL